MKLYFKDGAWHLVARCSEELLYTGSSLEEALSVYDCIPFLA